MRGARTIRSLQVAAQRRDKAGEAAHREILALALFRARADRADKYPKPSAADLDEILEFQEDLYQFHAQVLLAGAH